MIRRLLLLLTFVVATTTVAGGSSSATFANNINDKPTSKYESYAKAYNALANAVLAVNQLSSNTNNLRSSGNTRTLQVTPTKNKLSWPECFDQQKNAKECKTLIENEIEGHHISDLSIEIHRPRSPTQLQATYQKVEIVANVFGKVVGVKNNGMVTYPFDWELSETDKRPIGPWDCTFMDATDCCDKIREDVPDADKNGRHIDCFVTELGLEPKPNVDGGIDYYTFIYDTFTYKYTFQKIAIDTIESAERKCMEQLTTDMDTIDTILSNEAVSSEDLHVLEHSLMLHSRSMGDVQNLVSELYLARLDANGGVNHPNDSVVVDVSSTTSLAVALEEIKTKTLDFMQHMVAPRAKISIRVDETDVVMKTPTVGAVDYFIDSTDLLSGGEPVTGEDEEDPFGGMLGGGPGGFPIGGMLPPEGVELDFTAPKYCGNVTPQDGLSCSFDSAPCNDDTDCLSDKAAPYCLSECGPMI